MNEVRWMSGAAVASWLAASVVFGTALTGELLLGMVGPLAAVVVSWVVAERTWRASPERLTAVMIAAFAAKMVFFGVYVTIMLKVLNVRPLPFVISFTCSFIGLHLFEALCLQRFFAAKTPAPQ